MKRSIRIFVFSCALALALVIGFFVVVRIVKRQRQAVAQEITAEDMERLKALRSEAEQIDKNEGGAG